MAAESNYSVAVTAASDVAEIRDAVEDSFADNPTT
jgi:hypothetical protein